MIRFAWLFAAAWAALAQPAFAGGDVCILHGSSLVILSKPKLPKPGGSTPLIGLFDTSPEAPISGTLSRGVTGTLRAGITYHLGDGVTCFEHVTLDESFEGSGTGECTDDLGADFAVTWERVDC